MDTKKCSKCGEVKSVSEFYKINLYLNKYRNECKKCFHEKYDKNKEIYYLNRRNKKQYYPCLICGHGISKENNLCTRCKVKRGKYSRIKCDWCNEIKDSVCFSHGSKANYGNGKKIFCIDCKEKYYSQIRKKMWDNKRKRDFYKKHFDLKNGDFEKFKKYLLKSNNFQHEYMKEIDYESYGLALKLKNEAAINKHKRQNEKRKIRRLIDEEYNKRQKNKRREIYNSKYIRITLGDGARRSINVEKCPDEMKEAVQGLIDLRKKNKFIKEIQNG